MKRLLLTVVVSGLAAGVGPALFVAPAHAAAGASSDAIPASSDEGTYVPTSPSRVFDSRQSTPLRRGNPVTVPVLGKGGVPSSGVSAVVINLTATGSSASGFLTAYQSTKSSGGTSSLLFAKGDTRASLVTVPVGSDGSIKVVDGGAASTVNAVVDVQGYYKDGTSDEDSSASGATFLDEEPYRLLDTRDENSGGAVKPNSTLNVTVTENSGEFGTDAEATALAVNITAVSPTGPGYLTAWDGASAKPETSNVNFVKGQITPNNAVVRLNRDDESDTTASFSIFNGGTSSTQVVVDVLGQYMDSPFGPRFVPLDTPKRIVDSRNGTGATRLGADMTKTVQAPASVLETATNGYTDTLVGSLTAVKPTASTFLTVYPTDGNRPTASNLNPSAGQTVANHAFVALSDADQSNAAEDRSFNIYNLTGSTDVLVDVVGRFDEPDYFADASRKQGLAAQSQARALKKEQAQHPVKLVKVTRTRG